MYEAYKNNPKVTFFFVYVNEAHPKRRRNEDPKDLTPRAVGKARNLKDRLLAASKCMVGLKLTLPALVDTMDGVAEKAYHGRPSATAVIDMDGKIRLHTIGPWGAQPGKAGEVLQKVLGILPSKPAGKKPRKKTRPGAKEKEKKKGKILLKAL